MNQHPEGFLTIKRFEDRFEDLPKLVVVVVVFVYRCWLAGGAIKPLREGFHDSFPLDSFPPDSFPLDSFPPDSFPPDNFPLDNFPLDNFPLDSFPPDSFPLDSFSPDSFPLLTRHFPTPYTTFSHSLHDIFPLLKRHFPTIRQFPTP